MRLFVALNLPAAERERLHRATAPLRDSTLPVRWTPPEAIHLTLKFLGEVAEPDVEAVRAALDEAAAHAPPVEIEIGGVGAFPDLRRPRIVWIGVQARTALLRLQRAVEEALEPLGFPAEERAYTPHLTLGRTRRDARPGELTVLESLASEVSYRAEITARTLDLMRSRLGPGGARYERIHAAPLGKDT